MLRCLRRVRSIKPPGLLQQLGRKYSTESTTPRDLSYKLVGKGSTYNDHVFVKTTAGRGGDGCVSFLREKYLAKGPPNGGSGGHGGDVYIMAVEGENSLSTPQMIRSAHGQGGRGSSMNGKKGEDVVIKVPVGTVVRELDMPERMTRSDVEDERGPWVHYPRYEDDNVGSDRLREAEKILRKQQRSLLPSISRNREPVRKILLDLDTATPANNPFLLCRGGLGGFGNTFFLTADNRAPRFASRGLVGEERYFELELKTLADIGLVGLPNAGKSTFLGAISNAKPRVADWAFTTLTPYLGTISDNEGSFTVADIPGIIHGASENRGLGHDFLRHIERAGILAFVIDLSGTPVEDYLTLRAELEAYSPGLETRQAIIIGNKADLDGTMDGLRELRIKVDEVWNRRDGKPGAGLDRALSKPLVIPLSSKDQMGVKQAIGVMKSLIAAQRQRQSFAKGRSDAASLLDPIKVVQG
ncbi:protein of unknown function [Taphrina deformans PYCC 5710]|uniref:Uncharacterized protein n=1 Tax=Taphrina deformans (strain PYCC 5710 / ATCC 11124 / CBS 356.35 / IMI 108563 / JCM 9778 / NBRC 8474) TaxID=1097556 RepID=R4XH12_TAPDE|nr:protein of unknown function [Taphrina deformans PYCC 5710]|eukprot:CCG84978.1 protein of unknown function [Taphrina deformans PYCC 5710]